MKPESDGLVAYASFIGEPSVYLRQPQDGRPWCIDSVMVSRVAHDAREAGVMFWRECLAYRFLLYTLSADLFGDDADASTLGASVVSMAEEGTRALTLGEEGFMQDHEAHAKAQADVAAWVEAHPGVIDTLRADFARLAASFSLTESHH